MHYKYLVQKYLDNASFQSPIHEYPLEYRSLNGKISKSYTQLLKENKKLRRIAKQMHNRLRNQLQLMDKIQIHHPSINNNIQQYSLKKLEQFRVEYKILSQSKEKILSIKANDQQKLVILRDRLQKITQQVIQLHNQLQTYNYPLKLSLQQQYQLQKAIHQQKQKHTKMQFKLKVTSAKIMEYLQKMNQCDTRIEVLQKASDIKTNNPVSRVKYSYYMSTLQKLGKLNEDVYTNMMMKYYQKLVQLETAVKNCNRVQKSILEIDHQLNQMKEKVKILSDQASYKITVNQYIQEDQYVPKKIENQRYRTVQQEPSGINNMKYIKSRQIKNATRKFVIKKNGMPRLNSFSHY